MVKYNINHFTFIKISLHFWLRLIKCFLVLIFIEKNSKEYIKHILDIKTIEDEKKQKSNNSMTTDQTQPPAYSPPPQPVGYAPPAGNQQKNLFFLC